MLGSVDSNPDRDEPTDQHGCKHHAYGHGDCGGVEGSAVGLSRNRNGWGVKAGIPGVVVGANAGVDIA